MLGPERILARQKVGGQSTYFRSIASNIDDDRARPPSPHASAIDHSLNVRKVIPFGRPLLAVSEGVAVKVCQ